MTAEEQKDTKRKIIEVANELFAAHGFSGTSVRDIASGAGVNLAAINYHFKNKENLYWQVFDFNYVWMTDSIAALGEQADNTEDLAIKVFRFFVSNEHAMMNTFKIFISEMEPPEGLLLVDREQNFGPPGQEIFLKKIEQEFSVELPYESKQWAVKMIFALIFHYGVILNTKFMKKRCLEEEHLRPEVMENSLRHSIRSHLQYLPGLPPLS